MTYWAHVLVDRYLTMSLGRTSMLHQSNYSTPDVELGLPKTSLQHHRAHENVPAAETQDYEDSVLKTLHYSILLWRIGDRSLRAIYQWGYAKFNEGLAQISRTY